LAELVDEDCILFRYATVDGLVVPEANPNGSLFNIAGICNKQRNVFGMMPHPERACEAAVGSSDGLTLLRSLMETLETTAHPRMEKAAV
jgi:phosphoribosylformylglycinamidine synthase